MLKVRCSPEGEGARLTQTRESDKTSQGTIWKEESKIARWEKRQFQKEGKVPEYKWVLAKCKGFPGPQKIVNTYPLLGASWGLHQPLCQPTNHTHMPMSIPRYHVYGILYHLCSSRI